LFVTQQYQLLSALEMPRLQVASALAASMQAPSVSFVRSAVAREKQLAEPPVAADPAPAVELTK
jgi:hypothetical protein